ncbi:extracellular solute-binding protein family 5 [Ancylobacter novellus DSM 506]|uniref:Extracellular solute-binding protein family 5 n=1 Tax=Ancylobacter novellus (strain ATCC 8093 / DSM 506 / JCM 20403 / CCM 1077 / IAM 12100 / NBRC 12443 / NCIMB 10456) TaxID=639283 RepID=D7A2K8_ANCN5|nr:extracellular solute-binding protein family 5 [Ancylobacter novellus DSM 506]
MLRNPTAGIPTVARASLPFSPAAARRTAAGFAAALLGVSLVGSFAPTAHAQGAKTTLVVAAPRTPESLDQEYPPTEAGHEVRRNVNERLLAYAQKKGDDGVLYEDFTTITGALAESYELSPDKTSITFKLRKGVKSYRGNELNADTVMWSFERGWNMKSNFHWYMTQIFKIQDPKAAFTKIDDYTVKVTIPNPSPLLDRIWINSDLGILDATEVKKHLTSDDPWAGRWLSTNTASFGPYQITKYAPGQEVVYEANTNYWRGPAKLTKVILREMPTSANRVAALQAGSVDVAEYLLPRELALLEKMPGVTVHKVFGNYIHRVELNNAKPPFDNVKVRQAMNYLVPREEILKSVYFNTARFTKSPISEIYPAFTDEYFFFKNDPAKAKALLAEAGMPEGFKTQLAYRTGDQIEEEIAVILKSAFAKAGVEVELLKMPASTLVERYTKGEVPMYFFRDMAIVPDAAYVANLWLNSASAINYSKFKSEEVDQKINAGLTSTDEAQRVADMKRVQQLTMESAPWVFLMNPGYQLATRSNVKGYSWYTPNGNAFYDMYKD